MRRVGLAVGGALLLAVLTAAAPVPATSLLDSEDRAAVTRAVVAYGDVVGAVLERDSEAVDATTGDPAAGRAGAVLAAHPAEAAVAEARFGLWRDTVAGSPMAIGAADVEVEIMTAVATDHGAEVTAAIAVRTESAGTGGSGSGNGSGGASGGTTASGWTDTHRLTLARVGDSWAVVADAVIPPPSDTGWNLFVPSPGATSSAVRPTGRG